MIKKSLRQIKKENAEFARAVKFLIDKILDENGKQKVEGKPLLAHSLDVAYKLRNLGYENDLVLAAVLHDLIEDAGISAEEIRKKFGSLVCELVEAVSFKDNIEDKATRYQEMYKRTKEAGKDALILKTADLLANYNFFHFVRDHKLKKFLVKKYKYFLTIAQPISQEPIYQELSEKIKNPQK